MLSNFLIGRGVAGCCAALRHPQWGETELCSSERKKRGKEMRWIVNLLELCSMNRVSEFSMKISFFWILVDRYTLLDCSLCLFSLFIIVLFYWGWPSKSIPSDWVSYSTPAGLCTVHVNMITSLEDARIRLYAACACPQRECTEKLLYWPLQHRRMDWIYLHNGFSHHKCLVRI